MFDGCFPRCIDRPKKRKPGTGSLPLQRFRYDDGGYISCAEDDSLVLGVTDTEGRIIEVVLTRRRPDDVMQRWSILDNGYVAWGAGARAEPGAKT